MNLDGVMRDDRIGSGARNRNENDLLDPNRARDVDESVERCLRVRNRRGPQKEDCAAPHHRISISIEIKEVEVL